MKWYCETCKTIHADNEMCPHIKKQLKKHPEWLAEVTDFTVVAGEEALVTSQALDVVAQGINKIADTNLTYEGTHQFARDIQVFKRLNDEPFSRSGHFSTPESAKAYLENVLDISKDKPRAMTSFDSKLTGYGQEVDWLRMKKGQISSLWQKSQLLDNNAPGIDGITVNRFTGKQISQTTIKASINPMTSNSTGIKDVQEAIKKGYATSNDIIYGPNGTLKAARDAGLKNPVVEQNNADKIKLSNDRLKYKILNGQATTSVTAQQLGKQMSQGAIVGAAVCVTVSAISSYVRYKNGEITREAAYKEVSEDTLKGAITGAALSAVTIFLPGGVIGFAAGMAIGIYVNAVCTNILDEIYGKGAYGAILNASGYIYGMTYNLAEYYEKIEMNRQTVRQNMKASEEIQEETNINISNFEQMRRNRI